MKVFFDIKNQPIPSDPAEFSIYANELVSHIKELEYKISILQKGKFGSSSEKLPYDPSLLFNEIEDISTEDSNDSEENDKESITYTRKKRRKNIEIPDSVTRNIIVHDLSLEERQCMCCGNEMAEIGEERTEKLNVIPAKISADIDIYKKYACKNKGCDSKPKQTPTKAVAIPRIKATEDTLAFIATQKYLYGLPLYRLEYFFSNLGVTLSRCVMSNWMIKLAEALKPIYLTLEEKLLDSSYVHIDETRLQVLKENGRKAQTQSFAWVRVTGDPKDPPIILFHYSPTRSATVARDLLSGFSGFVQSDDYEGYACALNTNDNIQRLLCWDHARRYFHNAYLAIPEKNRKNTVADQVLKLIKKLYKIESKIKEEGLEERLKRREVESLKALDKIKLILDDNSSKIAGGSPTLRAINYTLDNWELLKIYTTDARLNISNCPAEQAIRPFVIGRKAWLFSNTPAGADASMILYSIIITAKANGLDPYNYIKKTLKALPRLEDADEMEKLLPLKQHGL